MEQGLALLSQLFQVLQAHVLTKKRKSKDGEYYFPQSELFSSRDTHFGVHLDRSLDVPGRPLGGVVVAKLDLHQEVRRLRVLQKKPKNSDFAVIDLKIQSFKPNLAGFFFVLFLHLHPQPKLYLSDGKK